MVLIALLGLALLLIIFSVKHIPEGMAYTLQRANGRARLLREGTHLVLPLVERVRHKISLTGRIIELQGEDQSVRLYWQVIDPIQADGLIDQAESLLGSEVQDLLKPVDKTPPASLEDLKGILNARYTKRGLRVIRVESSSD